MRLMIVRHGDPDYEKDSLTPAGWKEAEALSERMK
jgi:probable phosphoglycerate mutase